MLSEYFNCFFLFEQAYAEWKLEEFLIEISKIEYLEMKFFDKFAGLACYNKKMRSFMDGRVLY